MESHSLNHDRLDHNRAVDEICALSWSSLTRDELMAVAGAYYFFSIQFCETVEIACNRYPADEQLSELREGECNTDNLSPYPDIAAPGEKMDHAEFMRRVVAMSGLDERSRSKIALLGAAYLAQVREIDPTVRINSLPSYEDGGLERVFRAVLDAPDWEHKSLAAFRHFLVGHINLDSDPDAGHGALCRHLVPDDRIVPLWTAFRNVLVSAAPTLAHRSLPT